MPSPLEELIIPSTVEVIGSGLNYNNPIISGTVKRIVFTGNRPEFNKYDGYYCFHAGTKFDGDKIVTNGGRVLGVTAKGKDLKEARANAYAATEWVNFANKYKRNDIGKAIDEA